MVKLNIDASEVEGAVAAGIAWFRWTGPDMTALGACAELAEGAAEVVLSSGPADPLLNTLPEELGGPVHFGLGYPVALSAADGGDVVGWCRDVRVLQLGGPLPVDKLREMALSRPPRGVQPEEIEAMFADAAALTVGLSLASVKRPTRSLMGFAPFGADEATAVVTAGEWPPKHF